MSCVVGGPLARLRVSWLAACVLLLSSFTPRVTVYGLQLVAAARARKRTVVLCMWCMVSRFRFVKVLLLVAHNSVISSE